MANKYPYVASSGPLVKTIEHLRRSFPKTVTADTLRKLGVAPKNESYAINVLKFLGVIDEEGNKVEDKATAFVQHADDQFHEHFGQLVKDAYEELFELRGDDAWEMDRSSLTQFFRTSDHSSDIVGNRQAGTFMTLSGLSGHGEQPKAASPRKPTAKETTKGTPRKAGAAAAKSGTQTKPTITPPPSDPRVGLTVRIEVNLPASGDQQTYDRIFQSIRKNLIDVE